MSCGQTSSIRDSYTLPSYLVAPNPAGGSVSYLSVTPKTPLRSLDESDSAAALAVMVHTSLGWALLMTSDKVGPDDLMVVVLNGPDRKRYYAVKQRDFMALSKKEMTGDEFVRRVIKVDRVEDIPQKLEQLNERLAFSKPVVKTNYTEISFSPAIASLSLENEQMLHLLFTGWALASNAAPPDHLLAVGLHTTSKSAVFVLSKNVFLPTPNHKPTVGEIFASMFDVGNLSELDNLALTDEEILALPAHAVTETPCGKPDRCAAACEKKEASACVQLASMHRWSSPFRPSNPSARTAVELLRKACDLGNGEGCRRLATAYSTGSGVSADAGTAQSYDSMAQALSLAACQRGDGLACMTAAPRPAELIPEPDRASLFDIRVWRWACRFGVAEGCEAYAGYDLQERDPKLDARFLERAQALNVDACQRLSDKEACRSAARWFTSAHQYDQASGCWATRFIILNRLCTQCSVGACLELADMYNPRGEFQGYQPTRESAASWAEQACACEPKVVCGIGACKRAVDLGGHCPPKKKPSDTLQIAPGSP